LLLSVGLLLDASVSIHIACICLLWLWNLRGEQIHIREMYHNILRRRDFSRAKKHYLSESCARAFRLKQVNCVWSLVCVIYFCQQI